MSTLTTAARSPQVRVITGGSGFLGQHFARAWVAQGHRVISFARRPCPVPGVESILGDILSPPDIEQLPDHADLILHLAANTSHEAITGRPQETLRLAVEGTLNALDYMDRAQVPVFAFASSGKVYGATPIPFREEYECRPTTLLGRGKLLVERLIETWCQTVSNQEFRVTGHGSRFPIFRFFNLYGPGQPGSFLIPTILRQLPSGHLRLGQLDHRRDYLYIEDAVHAVDAVLAACPAGVSRWNVGRGASASAEEILLQLAESTGRRIEVEVLVDLLRPHERYEERADTSRLTALGWKPMVSLEEGLLKMLENYNSRNLPSINS